MNDYNELFEALKIMISLYRGSEKTVKETFIPYWSPLLSEKPPSLLLSENLTPFSLCFSIIPQENLIIPPGYFDEWKIEVRI